jgi:CPA2 family monovalent cation:H+ antiporter-2
MHLAPLIRDLALILGVAAVVTLLFKKIRQPVVLGYILAGVIVGPYAPDVVKVADLASVKTWAELGIIFLMFSMGLEFSFAKLARVGGAAGVSGVIELLGMVLLGYFAGRALGMSSMSATFVACMVAISSTTIIIKALEELGMKGKRFAEQVFGVLVIEDLAAILMLVALASIAKSETVSGVTLLIAGIKLLIVVGAWYLIGMFAVPRFVSSIGRHGNDEMLIIASLGLCLGLVTVAASLEYSVALGAFIMGSILAESSQVKRIEHLVQPLRDLFGAVFFVSVGMLLDPSALLDNLGLVLTLSLVVIAGKILFVTAGTLASGSTLKTAVSSGLSMAQIGEFSFIIATLGVTQGAIDQRLYPVIVAVSLVTTFTTPYLIKVAPRVVGLVDDWLPSEARQGLERYAGWAQQRLGTSGTTGPESADTLRRGLVRWLACGILMTTVFAITASTVHPMMLEHLSLGGYDRIVAWALAFIVSSPFTWGMLMAFERRARSGRSDPGHEAPSGLSTIVARLGAIVLLGLVSLDYFDFWFAVGFIGIGAFTMFIVFRGRIDAYYRWFELRFIAGMDGSRDGSPRSAPRVVPHHLLPWDAQLTTVRLHPESRYVGRRLSDLRLRERYGVNVVVIERNGRPMVAPPPSAMLFPGDRLLCFGTEAEIRLVVDLLETASQESPEGGDLDVYALRQVAIGSGCKLQGKKIRDSQIREQHDCIVVGVERENVRIANPSPDFQIDAGDRLWVVGEKRKIDELARSTAPRLMDPIEARV